MLLAVLKQAEPFHRLNRRLNLATSRSYSGRALSRFCRRSRPSARKARGASIVDFDKSAKFAYSLRIARGLRRIPYRNVASQNSTIVSGRLTEHRPFTAEDDIKTDSRTVRTTSQ